MENVESFENYAPEKLKEIVHQIITEADLIEGIKFCLKISPLINPTKPLINSVYAVLKGLLIDDKKYAIIEAPTGSGKTIIGFMIFFVTKYIYEKKNLCLNDDGEISQLTYFLTSAKMLQEQIDQDLDRFNFRDSITMLKGTTNYDCLPETENLKYHPLKDDKGILLKRISYADRPCKGLNKNERSNTYASCDPICPYQLARFEAAEKTCTVLNYAYFLNVMRSKFNPFFDTRLLTIADEAHLIPEIVCNTFNFEFNQFATNQIWKLVSELELNFGSGDNIQQLKELMSENFQFFVSELKDPKILFKYFLNISSASIFFEAMKKNEKFTSYQKAIGKCIDRIKEIQQIEDNYRELIDERPIDIYFESNLVVHDKTTNSRVFKHIIRDLSEAQMVRTNFLSKIDKGIFMSATLGDIDEYATLMGMQPYEYVSLRLPSMFDFSKSPIYLCKSAYLNYTSFDKNIDKALMDTIKICNTLHPKEKGIIHTSTFKICNLLKDKINLGLVPDKTRFLFYQNAEEKEQLVNMMKNSAKPYIIVGPSLYEGLDLKDDNGRFNILIKVPYSGLDPYIKKKMERYPFWYERNTLEKCVQSIGRTNRHINDYSSVYLIDTIFDKLIWKTNESIISRIQNLTIR
jgi:Rad3-related DNA helicase